MLQIEVGIADFKVWIADIGMVKFSLGDDLWRILTHVLGNLQNLG